MTNMFEIIHTSKSLDGSPIAAEALDSLDTDFKAILSLQQIVFKIMVYGDQHLKQMI